MARRTIAFWILFTVTAMVYAVIVGWSLPSISRAAGGATPFDVRPTGYTFEEAKSFLAALTQDGRELYVSTQQRLDLFYPALLGTTMFSAIYLIAPPRWGAWRWVLALTAIPSSLFDYLENHAVANMLRLGPEAITPEIVAASSRWTLFKSLSTTFSMVILLAILLTWMGTRFIARYRGRTPRF